MTQYGSQGTLIRVVGVVLLVMVTLTTPVFLLAGLVVGLVSWVKTDTPPVPPTLEVMYRMAQADTGVPWQAMAAWDAAEWSYALPVDPEDIHFQRLHEELLRRKEEWRAERCAWQWDPDNGVWYRPPDCDAPPPVTDEEVQDLREKATALWESETWLYIYGRAKILRERVELFAVNPEAVYRGLLPPEKVTYAGDLFEGYLLAEEFEEGFHDEAPIGIAPALPPGFTPSPGWAWPAKGSVTSRYGSRISPIDGQPRFHAGMDIGVPTGTEVRASKAGRVLVAEWDPVYGHVVVLDHGNGYTSLYAHNAQLKVKPGQEVRQGALLALAGSSGQSTGPHVHFEIRLNGNAYDPLLFLDQL